MEKKNIVCISCYYKGYDFMDEMHRLGNNIILITTDTLKEKNWPWHAIGEVYYMNEIEPSIWNLEHLVQGFSHLMQNVQIDAVIALDDYDVEKAALIRETFRISGMGQTTHRYFRDKLAMRQQAKDSGIAVPEFSSIFNNNTLENFTQRVSPPWVLKPRSEASASGIKKINSTEELWQALEKLGDERHKFLIESFKPGDVFHVDSLVYGKEVIFTSASQYLSPPMEVSHEGGVFRTKTLCNNSEEYKTLKELNAKVLTSFGLAYGATHTEFIRGKEDGVWYFLETSARVGGAHIPEMVEAATEINIWREWAKIENARLNNVEYQLPESKNSFSGLIIALARDKNPNRDEYYNSEVLRFIDIDHHIGILYKSDNKDLIQKRLDEAAITITEKVLNVLPPREKPTA